MTSGYGAVIPLTHAAIKKVNKILNELGDSEKVAKLHEDRGFSNFFFSPKNHFINFDRSLTHKAVKRNLALADDYSTSSS